MIEMDGCHGVPEFACSTTRRIALVLDTSNDPMLHVRDFFADTKLVHRGNFHSLNFSRVAIFLDDKQRPYPSPRFAH